MKNSLRTTAFQVIFVFFYICVGLGFACLNIYFAECSRVYLGVIMLLSPPILFFIAANFLMYFEHREKNRAFAKLSLRIGWWTLIYTFSPIICSGISFLLTAISCDALAETFFTIRYHMLYIMPLAFILAIVIALYIKKSSSRG